RGRVAARAGAWAQSERTGSLGSSLDLPSEIVVDLGLALEVARGVTVRLDGRNVLGTRGYTAARTRPGDGVAPLLVAWPNRGREVRIGLVMR
ncbi:hypothetical protein, partial [Rubrivirga sp.]|uniref:hypothetical protein n=1 Tax=Rubrivirga sp. TaxID=1885344 RepID=UPI003C7432EB